MATDCNGRQVYLDPHLGTALQVAECARNLACVGAKALGVTDCLNFGNPEKPEIMWQFARSVEGMGEACRALGIPVVSGNVSLYNETDGTAILPTPGIAMVGLYEGEAPEVSSRFEEAGLGVALLGGATSHLGGSLYLYAEHALERGLPPDLDYDKEGGLQDCLRQLVRDKLVKTAHDLSDGGLAVALAEACLGGVGADVLLPGEGRWDGRLFGEDASRVLIAFDPDSLEIVEAACKGLGFQVLGRTGGDRLKMVDNGRPVLDLSIQAVHKAWIQTLPEML
jgi:phosphoribosylformylglycinamidine synthase